MKKTGLLKMHRIQSSELLSDNSRFYDSLNIPVKRVLISNLGNLEFNPDAKQYIYFSKTDKHHIYYIFNKIVKIITDELTKSANSNVLKKLKLPENFQPFYLYSSSHTQIIKQVKDFFYNYLPAECVELVTLNYLNCFSDFFNRSCILNTKKHYNSLPEISDKRTFGGAYGINSSWLELLKCCTYSTSHAKLYLHTFFDFMISNSYRGATCRSTLKQLIIKNPDFMNILNLITYTELQNPCFHDKNNINNIRKSISDIKRKQLYNPDLNLTTSDFQKEIKFFKNEIELYR